MPAAKPRVTFNAEKLDALAKYFSGMERRVDDFSVPLTDVANLILHGVEQAFVTSGASVGETWAPHAPDTIRRWGEHPFGAGPNGNMLRTIGKFVRKFVCGVQATAPHAPFFENGTNQYDERRFQETVTESDGTRRVDRRNRRHSRQGPDGQGWSHRAQEHVPPREFMSIAPATEDASIEIILNYFVGDNREAA